MSKTTDPFEQLRADETIELLSERLNLAPLDDDRRRSLKSQLMQRISDPADLFIVRADDGQWHPLRAGITVKHLNTDPETGHITSLWRLEPGATTRAHAHEHDEECLVLSGTITIGDTTLVTGDYLLGKSGIDHPEFTTRDGALLLIRGAPIPLGP